MKSVKNILYTLLCVLLAGSEALAATLSGTVVDERSMPLVGVSVLIDSLQRGGLTDEKGVFRIENLPEGRFTVQFRYIGYKPENRVVTLSRGSVELRIVMTPEPLEGETVNVTAERPLPSVSQSATALSAEKLEESRGQTLGETVKSIPGVTTMTTGAAVSKPVVRGLHSQRVLVMNADVAHGGQEWGADHAPEIDPFAPARIEVLKGASSVQFGAGAIGGVIRVLPRELRREPGFSGQFNMNGFSNNRQAAGSLTLEGGLRRLPGVSWLVQGSLRRAGDSRTPTHIIENTGFEEKDWAAALGYHREHSGVEAYYSHFGAELGIYRNAHIGNTTNLLEAIERGQPSEIGDFSYAITPPKQKVDHDLFSLRAHMRWRRAGVLSAHYAQQYNERQEFDAHDPNRPGFDLGLLSQSGEITFEHIPTMRWSGKTGIALQRQSNTTFSVGFLIPDFLAYSGGAFAYEQWTEGALILEGGVRYDYRWQDITPNRARNIAGGTQTYSNVSAVLGATYRFSPAFSLSGNIGQAWRPPSVNELFSSGLHHGSAQIEYGDPGLETEKSVNTDVTLRYRDERVQAELSGFYTRFSNFITLFPEKRIELTIRGAFPVFRYTQTRARLYGFDGFLDYHITPRFGINFSIALVRGQDTKRNAPLYLITPDRLSAGMEIHLPEIGRLKEQRLEVSMGVTRHQNRFPSGADFVDPPDGYALASLHYHADVPFGSGHLSVQFGIENLFNTRYRDYLSRYRYFIDDPGRDMQLRLSVPFGRPE